jgi:hypothetical protein
MFGKLQVAELWWLGRTDAITDKMGVVRASYDHRMSTWMGLAQASLGGAVFAYLAAAANYFAGEALRVKPIYAGLLMNGVILLAALLTILAAVSVVQASRTTAHFWTSIHTLSLYL